MKTALTFVCLLALVWSQAGLAQTRATGVERVAQACGCKDCSGDCCCVAPAAPMTPPAATPPLASGPHPQLSFLAPATVVWNLPEDPAGASTSAIVRPVFTPGPPLYERDCARLI